MKFTRLIILSTPYLFVTPASESSVLEKQDELHNMKSIKIKEEASSLTCTKQQQHYPNFPISSDAPLWLMVANNVSTNGEVEDSLKFGPFFSTRRKRSGCLTLSLTANEKIRDHLRIARNGIDILFNGGTGLKSQWIVHEEILSKTSISEQPQCQIPQMRQRFRLSSIWLQGQGGLTIDTRTKKLKITEDASQWTWFVFSPTNNTGNKNNSCMIATLVDQNKSILGDLTCQTEGATKSNQTNANEASVIDPIIYYNAEVPLLTKQQKTQFLHDGYLKLDNVIPHDILAVAQKTVNEAQNDNAIDKLQQNDAILDLLRITPVFTLLQEIMGEGNICQKSMNTAQLRFLKPARFPKRNGGNSSSSIKWHVDGLLNFRKHSPFSVLVGISLSNWTEPDNGNLCVWPRSHSQLLPVLREVVENPNQMDFSEDVLEKLKTRLPVLGDGVQICANAGDVVFLHHKLAHGVAPNFGPNTRKQVYFRLRHKRHYEFVRNGVLLDNLWIEFPGIDPND